MLFKLFARSEHMTGQKIRCVQVPAAFALQFQNPQCVLAAGDNDSIFVGG